LYEYRCGDVRIQGIGQAPLDDYPPSYFTTALIVRSGAHEPARVPISGTLYFSDWGYPPCSPDARWLVFLQDRFGPIHAVRYERLRAYLDGAAPDRVIAVDNDSAFAWVYSDIRWRAPSTLVFDTGGETTTVHEVPL
jgi:hypothetical protein